MTVATFLDVPNRDPGRTCPVRLDNKRSISATVTDRRYSRIMAVRFELTALAMFALAVAMFAQLAPNDSNPPVRVNVTVNPDGTRTSYQFDQAHHQATATTTTTEGKVTQKIK